MPRPHLPFARRAALVAACALLPSCAVGPDFERPAAPPVAAYTSPTDSAAPASGAQPRLTDADIPAPWPSPIPL
ncbi:hypothetical protein [Achromobacter ruhlandii]|uniref:hypothetical protein n=1 Tax=Achromobacter ruhlandii TaxID=72557 RepID=UPI001B8AB2A1|nr:hypothetical protein [Achromobacter ruhlandii]